MSTAKTSTIGKNPSERVPVTGRVPVTSLEFIPRSFKAVLVAEHLTETFCVSFLCHQSNNFFPKDIPSERTLVISGANHFTVCFDSPHFHYEILLQKRHFSPCDGNDI